MQRLVDRVMNTYEGEIAEQTDLPFIPPSLQALSQLFQVSSWSSCSCCHCFSCSLCDNGVVFITFKQLFFKHCMMCHRLQVYSYTLYCNNDFLALYSDSTVDHWIMVRIGVCSRIRLGIVDTKPTASLITGSQAVLSRANGDGEYGAKW